MDANLNHWSVTVAVDGDDVLTISHDHLAGKDGLDDLAPAIRTAAAHLLCFIGAGKDIVGGNVALAPSDAAQAPKAVAWECASPAGEKPMIAFLTSKEPTREHYEYQGWRVTPLYLAAPVAPQAAGDAAQAPLTTWQTGAPPTKAGDYDEYIVAVRRKAVPGRIFVFASNYANNYGKETLSDDEGNEYIADGWYTIGHDSSGEYDSLFMPMLDDGDEVIGWQALPKWSDAAPVATAAAVPIPLLAADHKGMRVDYSGVFKHATIALARGGKEPGLAEMLRQMKEHITELGQRWYAGDTAVVDELLQLYCVEKDARDALVAASGAAQ